MFREGVIEAGRLLTRGDPWVWEALVLTLGVSGVAVVLAALIGLPLGVFLARVRFRGRGAALAVLRAGLAMPTVFLGLVGYGLLSRRGSLGDLELLYTPAAIALCELVLALRIVACLTHGAVAALDRRVAETARTLGAGWVRRTGTYLSEARLGVALALLAAWGRCLTELGIAVMVGGNIRGRTRTLATAIALETGKGEFARGLAMGFVLLGLAFVIALGAALLARDRDGDAP